MKITREDDEEKRQAHKKEYAITSSLNHKNIVKSHQFFENESTGEIH